MPSVKPRTVGQALYWSYANLAMACASFQHDQPTYQQVDYIVRNKTYHGLLRGSLKIGSFVIDEREKLATSDFCGYCGSRDDLTVDHLIAQLRGGKHSADNLVRACRSCNSSKKDTDFLEWMARRGEFPPLCLLRRYLKLAISYCVETGAMDLPWSRSGASPDPGLFDGVSEASAAVPSIDPYSVFALGLLPHEFPAPPELVARVDPLDDTEEDVITFPAADGIE